MKKVYNAPAVQVIDIKTESMLAASIKYGDTHVDAGTSWSNDRRGDWGDIWSE